MSSEKLPDVKKTGFLEKLKAIFTGTNTPEMEAALLDIQNRKAALDKRESELDAKEDDLNKREEDLAKAEEEFIERARQLAEKERATATLKKAFDEREGIMPELSPNKKAAHEIIASRFRNLQADLDKLNTYVTSLNGTQLTAENNEMIKAEYSAIKGRIYGELAVAMTVLDPKEISTLKLGDSKTSIQDVAVQLPKMIKIEDGMAAPAMKAFVSGISDLANAQVLTGITPQEFKRRIKNMHIEEPQQSEKLFKALLEKYFGGEPQKHFDYDMDIPYLLKDVRLADKKTEFKVTETPQVVGDTIKRVSEEINGEDR